MRYWNVGVDVLRVRSQDLKRPPGMKVSETRLVCESWTPGVVSHGATSGLCHGWERRREGKEHE